MALVFIALDLKFYPLIHLIDDCYDPISRHYLSYKKSVREVRKIKRTILLEYSYPS